MGEGVDPKKYVHTVPTVLFFCNGGFSADMILCGSLVFRLRAVGFPGF